MASCDQERVGNATVIRPRGRFLSDEEAAMLEQALAGCVGPDSRCVVVNWSGVEYMNSIGFGAVVTGLKTIVNSGADLRNCCFPQRIKPLHPMLQMMFDWKYFETEQEAVHACDGSRPAGA